MRGPPYAIGGPAARGPPYPVAYNFPVRTPALRRALVLVAIIGLAGACSRTTTPAEKAAPGPVTFNHDIAPILYGNCASCHRPIDGVTPQPVVTTGSEDDPICVAGAPFSVLDYGSVRRHARAIAAAVQHLWPSGAEFHRAHVARLRDRDRDDEVAEDVA